MRIALALLAIIAVFLLPLVEVEFAHTYAEVHCGGYDEAPVATLPDLTACMAETRRVEAWRYCACSRPNRWVAGAYYYFLIPLVLTVTALLTLRGRLLGQTVQFIAAAILGIVVSQLLFPLTQDFPDEEANLIFRIYLCALALVGLALFILFRGAAAGIRSRRARNAKLAAA
jgi:hypothetical protein